MRTTSVGAKPYRPQNWRNEVGCIGCSLTYRQSPRPPPLPPRHFEGTDRVIVLVVVPRILRPCESPLGPPEFPVEPSLVPGIPHGRVPRFLEGDAGKDLIRLHEQVCDRVALGVEFRAFRVRPEAGVEAAADLSGVRGLVVPVVVIIIIVVLVPVATVATVPAVVIPV